MGWTTFQVGRLKTKSEALKKFIFRELDKTHNTVTIRLHGCETSFHNVPWKLNGT